MPSTRQMRAFRLSQQTVDSLEELSRKNNTTMTHIVELSIADFRRNHLSEHENLPSEMKLVASRLDSLAEWIGKVRIVADDSEEATA